MERASVGVVLLKHLLARWRANLLSTPRNPAFGDGHQLLADSIQWRIVLIVGTRTVHDGPGSVHEISAELGRSNQNPGGRGSEPGHCRGTGPARPRASRSVASSLPRPATRRSRGCCGRIGAGLLGIRALFRGHQPIERRIAAEWIQVHVVVPHFVIAESKR